MSTRVRAACLCLVLLLPVAAKPPDLPVDPRDQCKEHRPESLPADRGSQLDPAEEAGADVADAPAGVIDCGCEIAAALWIAAERWCAGVAEAIGASRTGPREAPHQMPCRCEGQGSAGDLQSDCPYLRERAARRAAPAAGPDDLSESIFENLDKLEQARKCYFRAEGYRKTDRPAAASLYYERAKYLCPGSRFDRLASERLRALYAGAGAGAAEEAEEPPSKRSGPGDTGVPAEVRVAELLEASQRAYADGRYAEAAALARQASRLDPGCAAARALAVRARNAAGASAARPPKPMR